MCPEHSDEQELPPLFYRYTPIGEWLLEFLKGKSLQFSSRSRFNDPFDCRPGFLLQGREDLEKFLHEKYKSAGLNGAARIKKVREAMGWIRSGRQLPGLSTDSILDNVGVLCLATAWNNPLMWSHYADHHRGICVAFHSDMDIFKIAYPVAYKDEFPVIVRPKDDYDEMFNKGFLTKAKCWEYENEWRIIKPFLPKEERDAEFLSYCPHMSVADARTLSDKRGPGIYEFPQSAIAEITLGMNMSRDDRNKFYAAFDKAGLNIPVYQVDRPSTSYCISRQQLAPHR